MASPPQRGLFQLSSHRQVKSSFSVSDFARSVADRPPLIALALASAHSGALQLITPTKK